MSEVAPQTLDIVGREIGGELNDARTAIEAFVEPYHVIATHPQLMISAKGALGSCG